MSRFNGLNKIISKETTSVNLL